ncbi:hypothetical protein [Mycobacterium sp. PSTR-4-N]|uniref:hypothetical protein n=1 Tax=Mycobacterium sp. PSTR-4-N TaxID=2917745 RepID=UPI001F15486A|nr:hypothetical protein [Mycobacterium sp. PSTR-4-N]MCG7596330.1 hypothetical protein [Mycobacterium sp. PSTR-4-N]
MSARELAERAADELAAGLSTAWVPAVVALALEQTREPEPIDAASLEPRVVDDANGHLDDFLARDVRMVHFEATDESAWYATIELADGTIWQLHFGARDPSQPGYSRSERIA